jgi:transcriptional regulator with XRE-family HTH domain
MNERLATNVPAIWGIPIPTLLREFRESVRLTQLEAAKKYRVSSRTWKRWESASKKRGAPNLSDHFELLRDFFTWLSRNSERKEHGSK